MPRCLQCQSVNPEGSTVCQHCGSALASVSTSAIANSSSTGLYSQTVPSGSIHGSSATSCGNGTDVALPALGEAAASAITVRNRINISKESIASPETVTPHSDLAMQATKPAAKADKSPSCSEKEKNVGHQEANQNVTNSKPQQRIVPRLVVLRGEHINASYPIYAGRNVIGRFADKPVDIDLESQELPDRIRVSRQHAVIHFDDVHNEIRIEDLNSLNGTWVNNAKLHYGHQRRLLANDILQIGTVQLKLVIDISDA